MASGLKESPRATNAIGPMCGSFMVAVHAMGGCKQALRLLESRVSGSQLTAGNEALDFFRMALNIGVLQERKAACGKDAKQGAMKMQDHI